MHLSSASRSTSHRSVRAWPVLSALAALSLTACVAEGPAGPSGPRGSDGAKGADGTTGTNGTNGTDGATGKDGKDGKDATVDPSLSGLEKAYLGLGGKEALGALGSFTFSADGASWVVSEGYEPDTVLKVASYKASVEQDLASGGARVDYDRTVNFFGFPQPLKYQEIIKGDVGVVAGTVSILPIGQAPGDMTSDRWASTIKTQRLLNPQLLLKDVAEDKWTAAEGGPAELDGALFQLVVLSDKAAPDAPPVTLWVSSQTGKIAKLATLENDHVLRDVPLEVFFEGWTPTDGGVSYPAAVYLSRDEVILRQEARSAFVPNAVIDAKDFEFPAGSAPKHDDALAAVGAANSQFNQMFAAVGIPLDGLQTFVQPVQVAAGVWQLLGGSHNSMVVEQTDGLVIADAPLYNQRTDAILAWAKTQYPNKPVKWVTITHFHDDHIGGLRAFAAEGAKIVVGAAAEAYLKRSLTARSTVVPDKLAMTGGGYQIIPVPQGEAFTIADALRPVTAYSFDSGHADGMLMIHVPNEKILWLTDVYNAFAPPPPPSANPFAQQARAAILAKGLDVQTLITGHGNGANTFAEFTTAIGL